MTASQTTQAVLNGICPYFTMFPLDFPLNILKRRAREGDLVLDPFCGRGTTNFAARFVGLSSLGVDSSPVAAAITASKLVTTTIDDVLAEAGQILAKRKARQIPASEF
ncbi:MAG: DNA methyltransferase [Methylococcales bacterium]